jgi:hypothetical protein
MFKMIDKAQPRLVLLYNRSYQTFPPTPTNGYGRLGIKPGFNAVVRLSSTTSDLHKGLTQSTKSILSVLNYTSVVHSSPKYLRHGNSKLGIHIPTMFAS